MSMEYCFFGAAGEEEDTDGETGMPTILILHDDSTDAMWTLGIQSNGVREVVIEWVTQKLEFSGHVGTELTSTEASARRTAPTALGR